MYPIKLYHLLQNNDALKTSLILAISLQGILGYFSVISLGMFFTASPIFLKAFATAYTFSRLSVNSL